MPAAPPPPTANAQPTTGWLPARLPRILCMTAMATPDARSSAPVAAPWARRARIDAGVRLGALAVLWLGLMLVSYWWAAGGGIPHPSRWGTRPTPAGRPTRPAAPA